MNIAGVRSGARLAVLNTYAKLIPLVLAFSFALTGAFKTLAVVGGGSLLLIYIGTGLAVLKLRRQDSTDGAGIDGFRVPGGPVVPIISGGVAAWLLSGMTEEEAIGLVTLLTTGSLLYLVLHFGRPRKSASSFR